LDKTETKKYLFNGVFMTTKIESIQEPSTAWGWLERFALGWHQNHGDAPQSKPQKRICWLEKGVEVFDEEKQLFVVPYDADKYEGEDFYHEKLELWVRPQPEMPIVKVPADQILAFDEKQGFLFIKICTL
jgi:hypothetical protein